MEGSRLQPGDEDLGAIPLRELEGQHLVIEEKLDGANAALSFASDGRPWLQSRGHYLTGGVRERHFDLFKAWVDSHRAVLFDRLQERFILYGEWLYARHTVYYDVLPHYFMEFDVLDVHEDRFLTTAERRALLDGLPVRSVPVLAQGESTEIGPLDALVRSSLYKSASWRERLRAEVEARGLDLDRALAQGDPSDLAEGLYIKVEGSAGVERRLKYVRPSFWTAVVDSECHWLGRPIIPSQLADRVGLFAHKLGARP